METCLAILYLAHYIINVINGYNLLCDDTLSWLEDTDLFEFNHPQCEGHWLGTPQIMDRIEIDVSSAFSNPPNFPLNFTITAVPQFGGWAALSIAFIGENQAYWVFRVNTSASKARVESIWPCSTCNDYQINFYEEGIMVRQSDVPISYTFGTISRIGVTYYGQQYVNGLLFTGFLFNGYGALTLPPTTTTPSISPTGVTLIPTGSPSNLPSSFPSMSPSQFTFSFPSSSPSKMPSMSSSNIPTSVPTNPSDKHVKTTISAINATTPTDELADSNSSFFITLCVIIGGIFIVCIAIGTIGWMTYNYKHKKRKDTLEGKSDINSMKESSENIVAINNNTNPNGRKICINQMQTDHDREVSAEDSFETNGKIASDALKQKHQNIDTDTQYINKYENDEQMMIEIDEAPDIPGFEQKISGSEGQQDLLIGSTMKSTNFDPIYGFVVNDGEDTVA